MTDPIKTKLAIVSYHNTIPFLDALSQSSLPVEVIEATPSKCAALFKDGVVDLALVPVGALAEIGTHYIVFDQCIGCDGPVYSVCLMSNVKIEGIESLVLDPESKTSNLLAQVILEEKYNVKPKIVAKEHANEASAYVLIGDKTFNLREQFDYCLDLGQEWDDLTTLPFVFAVWVSRLPKDSLIISELQKAFNNYFDSQWSVTIENKFLDPKTSLKKYLTEYIKYDFDSQKQYGLQVFQSKIQASALV